MAWHIPPPSARDLLPPLLACLPTAFAASRPPPALLPLLSPILRQRVSLLSSTASSDASWLPLLNWDSGRAAKLSGLAEAVQIEPHPVSGEIELPDVLPARYRRLDSETLQAGLAVPEYSIFPIYLWCHSDPQSADSWLLAELRALEDAEDGKQWFDSILEASENPGSRANGPNTTNGPHRPPPIDLIKEEHDTVDDDDDDDDYWAAYDRTPGRSPAKGSPASGPATRRNASIVSSSSAGLQPPSTSELEYFARYATEVQPAMDPHDPDEAAAAAAAGVPNSIHAPRDDSKPATANPLPLTPPDDAGGNDNIPGERQGGTNADEGDQREAARVSSPAPSSPDARSPGGVAYLERVASRQQAAEFGIKQHIATDIKSLYRLARAAGIERAEFERCVRVELELLGLMDLDE